MIDESHSMENDTQTAIITKETFESIPQQSKKDNVVVIPLRKKNDQSTKDSKSDVRRKNIGIDNPQWEEIIENNTCSSGENLQTEINAVETSENVSQISNTNKNAKSKKEEKIKQNFLKTKARARHSGIRKSLVM